MISRLTGRILTKQALSMILECGHIAYEIALPMSTFYSLPDCGQTVSLFIHFLVREDAHLLFGFLTEDERQVFCLLLRVSGIGTRIALAILSGVTVEAFYNALCTNNVSIFLNIPGIGAKTAARLLLELKDKAEKLAPMMVHTSTDLREVYEALLALGYSDKELRQVIKELPSEESVSNQIRIALGLLSASMGHNR